MPHRYTFNFQDVVFWYTALSVRCLLLVASICFGVYWGRALWKVCRAPSRLYLLLTEDSPPPPHTVMITDSQGRQAAAAQVGVAAAGGNVLVAESHRGGGPFLAKLRVL